MAFISAPYGLKGLPGPTGRFIHHEAALQHRRSLVAHGTRSKTRVLFLTGGTYLETPKHDAVGTVQMSGLRVAHLFVVGASVGHSSPA
jgi:hypothetical protein